MLEQFIIPLDLKRVSKTYFAEFSDNLGCSASTLVFGGADLAGLIVKV